MSGLDTRIVLIGLPIIAESLRTDLETVLFSAYYELPWRCWFMELSGRQRKPYGVN
jgi:hypothetical protein